MTKMKNNQKRMRQKKIQIILQMMMMMTHKTKRTHKMIIPNYQNQKDNTKKLLNQPIKFSFKLKNHIKVLK